jgi:hypothetical protein
MSTTIGFAPNLTRIEAAPPVPPPSIERAWSRATDPQRCLQAATNRQPLTRPVPAVIGLVAVIGYAAIEEALCVGLRQVLVHARDESGSRVFRWR